MVEVKTQEFSSMNEFYNYICNTPINDVFRWEQLESSSKDSKNWHGTKSFDEAVELMKNGYEDMAKKLEKKLNVETKQIAMKTSIRSQYDVAGFQCSVPRYLQGIPTNMINQKKVVKKQPVVTLNKNISYSAYTTPEQIIEYSTKALAIVKKIEAQGVRVNLNLIHGMETHNRTDKTVVKIRLKSANERMNISKLAFPLVHPSMLRRLLFRFIETSPLIKNKMFTMGYGKPMDEKDLEIPGEVLIPKVIGDINEFVEKINKNF